MVDVDPGERLDLFDRAGGPGEGEGVVEDHRVLGGHLLALVVLALGPGHHRVAGERDAVDRLPVRGDVHEDRGVGALADLGLAVEVVALADARVRAHDQDVERLAVGQRVLLDPVLDLAAGVDVLVELPVRRGDDQAGDQRDHELGGDDDQQHACGGASARAAPGSRANRRRPRQAGPSTARLTSTDGGRRVLDAGVRFPPETVGGVGHDGDMKNQRLDTRQPEGRNLDVESCYRAVKSRDRRFDGVFYTAVRTTGIYCRPSCPARTPAFHNVTFHPSAASAQAAGFRACKRCLPDATPGSPDWDVAATAAGRAMRLIADGVVDREGVDGLAHRVGYTPRHLTRLLTAELGAGPLALARARRAQTARVLVETTDLGFADVAFAAGFSSVRQFNDTVREVYAATPTELRGRRRGVPHPGHRDDAAGRAHAVRRSGAARLPRLPRRAGRRGGRPGLVRPHPRPPARPRHGPARARRRAGHRPDRVRDRRVPAARPARHLGRRRAGAPAGRRRLRPGRRRRPVPRRPGDRAAGPRDARAAGARPGRRRRDRDPHGRGPAGQRRGRAHGHRPAGRGVRHAGRDRHPRPDPPVPVGRDAGRGRPR